MPSAQPSLTPDDVRRFVAEECFATSSGAVGAEVEWLTHPTGDPRATASHDEVRSAVEKLGELPGGSRVTYEPGGQIELSSVPGTSAGETCERLALDEHAIKGALADRGIALTAAGLDPIRGHARVLHLPRYAAMEHYFDAWGHEGRRMMCRTASIQVNLDTGDGDAMSERWALMREAGPVLAAIFANSPLYEGRATGWKSTRLATWWSMDRTRTRPARTTNDPIESWSAYVLDARVMFVRVRPDWYEPLSKPMTFAEWIEHGHAQGFPTIDDLRYHTTTLFPPVRPRGWLEVRMIDALPDPWWRVAVAITAAVLDDEATRESVRAACGDTNRLWVTASRCGLEDPSLARAARALMVRGLEALPRIGTDPETQRAALAFAARFTFRGRSPADDVLDTWASSGRVPGETGTMEPAWI